MEVAFVSTYVPQKCGLATFTYHLRQYVRRAGLWQGTDPVIVMTSEEKGAEGRDSALWPLVKDNRKAYAEMAARVNESDVAVVSLQHEFGIFGGEAGSYILDFVRALKKPLVTTFHTVFENPEEPYRTIQKEIAARSERIVVMNRKAIGYLRRSYGIPEEFVTFIPHGTPVPEPAQRETARQTFKWSDRKVMMTFGLLSRGKGLEMIIRALPKVAKEVPNVLYAIVGQTHPQVKKQEGEAYRKELTALIRELSLEDHVVMIDRYVEEKELGRYLSACDLYVTPYPGMQQITSGTLAYAVGLGRPVLSTTYTYAQDLLEGCEELLLPYGDTDRWADKLIALLKNDEERRQLEKRIGQIGASMHWPIVGKRYAQLFMRMAKTQKHFTLKEGGDRIANAAR